MKKILVVLTLSLLFFINIQSSAQAAFTVPDDFPTIQEAIDAANPGDNIFVRAGTYEEAVIINKSGLVLEGENQQTIIQGVFGSDVIQVDTLTPDSVEIRGFNITGGSVGIHVMSNVTKLLIDNNLIAFNTGETGGKGILLEPDAKAVIQNNTINNNGRCIEALNKSQVEIVDNSISSCRGQFGGGIRLSESIGHIEGNTVSNCWDGGIQILLGSTAVIFDNTVTNNNSWNNPAGIEVSFSVAYIWRNIIKQNAVSNSGPTGGLRGRSSDLWVYNNTFNSNEFPINPTSHNGSAINVQSSDIVAKNNLITNNGSVGTPSTVFGSGGGTKEFTYNNFWNNTTDANTAGIVLGVGNLEVDPMYVDVNEFELTPGSLVIDAGDPDPMFNDPDGTRNDMGNHGGPLVHVPILDAGEDQIVDKLPKGDGLVDGSDFNIWQVAYGSVQGDNDYNSLADSDSDGDVDGTDFLNWQRSAFTFFWDSNYNFGSDAQPEGYAPVLLEGLVLPFGAGNVEWTVVSSPNGANVIFEDANSLVTNAILIEPGDYTLRLTVNGNMSDDVVITVNPNSEAALEEPRAAESIQSVINVEDFKIFENAFPSDWGSNNWYEPADFNDDLAVDETDLALLVKALGTEEGGVNWNPAYNLSDAPAVHPININNDSRLGVTTGPDQTLSLVYVTEDKKLAIANVVADVRIKDQVVNDYPKTYWYLEDCLGPCGPISFARNQTDKNSVSFNQPGEYEIGVLASDADQLRKNSLSILVDSNGIVLNPDPIGGGGGLVGDQSSSVVIVKKSRIVPPGEAEIEINLDIPQEVRTIIQFARTGQTVKTIHQQFGSGSNTLTWDGNGSVSGIYNVFIHIGEQIFREKLLLAN